jgi:hypothetical protein
VSAALRSWSITVQDERDDLTRSIDDGSPRLAVPRAGTLAGRSRKAGVLVVSR